MRKSYAENKIIIIVLYIVPVIQTANETIQNRNFIV